jgi:alginate O-acetyltransferase complex protein AlgI
MLYQQTWYLYFLVGTLVIYWGLCRSEVAKKVCLSVASLILLGSLQVSFTVALAGWAAAVYFAARFICHNQSSKRLRVLVLGILALLGYLSFFKYLPGILLALLGSGAEGGSSTWIHTNVVLPIGISYFTFKFIHYLVNAYRGTLAKHTALDFFLYTIFFPIAPAGPIERIENFVGKARLKWNASDFSYGAQRILMGAVKKLLLVDLVLIGVVTGPVYQDLVALRYDSLSVADVWIFLAGSFLYAYLDFSAYTDLAVGTARLFGFRICENFNFPIFKRNLSEFWKSWHMSLSSWCRDYVYMPVLAKTRMPRLALYASMMTIGAWHYLNFNWLVWGALHATGLVILMHWQTIKKRWFPRKSRSGDVFGQGVGMALTFGYVTWVFAFVCVPSPVAATQAFIYAASGWAW